MSDTVNATQRLCLLLSKIMQADRTSRIDNVLVNILEAEINMAPGAIKRKHKFMAYLDVISLIATVKKDAELLQDRQRELLLSAINVVEPKFAEHEPNDQAHNFYIDPKTLGILEASYLFFDNSGVAGKVAEKIIDKDKLSELVTSVDRLSKDVFDSDLPNKLKEYLFAALEKFRYAIFTYSINGVDGIMRSCDESVGLIYHAAQETKNDASSPEGAMMIVRHVYELMNHIVTLADFAQYTYAALPYMDAFLSSVKALL